MAGMVVEDKLAGLPPEEVLRRGRKLLQGLRNTVVSEQPPVGRYTGTAVCFGPEIARLFDFLVVALLADGHVLVRANVGVGKTLACSALA